MKNTPEEINSKLHDAEQTSDMEDKVTESTKVEQQKEKN